MEGWPPPFPYATVVRGENENIKSLDAHCGRGDLGTLSTQSDEWNYR